MIVKNNLEAVIRQVPPQEVPYYTSLSLKELSDARMIKKALVFDPNGAIIATTGQDITGRKVSPKDIAKIEELRAMSEKQWFIPDINKQDQAIYIYLILRAAPQAPMAYIVKLSYDLGNIHEALLDVYKPVAITIFIVILANFIFGYILSKIVIGPIKMLNDATKVIAAGDLSIRTSIRTNDELEELGSTFNCMTEALVKMKERAENANPLTKLPGNIVIREEIEKRIRANRKFMVIYCDLDNFKAFNDKYGIAKGDDAIKLTADIFKDAIRIRGNSDDFIGHEGGDDFMLLTTPDKSQAVADYITGEFDKSIRSLYTNEDLKTGYVIAHARDGSIKKFPIMSISLAGISNERRPIANYIEVTNIATELKKKAKSIEGSAFVMDKRAA
jgi:diguanylate cyclase (GGDEF)-like protein